MEFYSSVSTSAQQPVDVNIYIVIWTFRFHNVVMPFWFVHFREPFIFGLLCQRYGGCFGSRYRHELISVMVRYTVRRLPVYCSEDNAIWMFLFSNMTPIPTALTYLAFFSHVGGTHHYLLRVLCFFEASCAKFFEFIVRYFIAGMVMFSLSFCFFHHQIVSDGNRKKSRISVCNDVTPWMIPLSLCFPSNLRIRHPPL